MEALPTETAEAFAKRAQEVIATELQIPATNFKYEEKVKLRQKIYGDKA